MIEMSLIPLMIPEEFLLSISWQTGATKASMKINC